MRGSWKQAAGAACLYAALLAACATPPPAVAPAMQPLPAPAPQAGATGNYVTADATQLAAVLPPAPTPGDARDQADRRIFRETRALQGSPRWAMAAADAELGSAQMLKHFSCSLGMELAPQQAPRLLQVVQKATREAAAPMGRAKDFYRRPRPFNVDQGAVCVPASTVGASFDYPSGHATAGWAWALVLAQVDPPHAGAILLRGRAIGDSRVVCGMHNASAVEGARMLTGAAIATAAGSPQFQLDLAAARSELAGLRAKPHGRPEPANCAAEAELVKPYW